MMKDDYLHDGSDFKSDQAIEYINKYKNRQNIFGAKKYKLLASHSQHSFNQKGFKTPASIRYGGCLVNDGSNQKRDVATADKQRLQEAKSVDK